MSVHPPSDTQAEFGALLGSGNLKPRQLRPGQRAQLWVADAETGRTDLLLESSDLLFEAPNWTLDGARLIVNGDGALWEIPVADPALRRIDLTGVPDLNNDHVLDPDGEHIWLFAIEGVVH